MWPLDQADPARIGPYRLLARLGEGGMGTVYLAVGGGGERVALKSIRYGFTEDPDFRVRFAREIEAASLVRAGGIAQVVAAEPGADGQRPWVATEFVPGLPLQRLVATQGPLPAASAGTLAAGLARALEAVHAAGLVHRDVKPSNILLTVEGPRLIDFGVAKLVDASTGGGLTRTGASVGSPGYMSPEQVLGRALTPASDVFGLGGVLVFAATGRLPFPVPDSTNQHALMYAVVQDSPALDDVPDELRPLVAECLAKDPADRPDALALAARLAPYAALLDGDGDGDGDGNGDGSAGAGARAGVGAAFADPWLPARALAEVARISGRAAAQGEWRPGAGAEAAGSASGAAGPGSGPGGAGAEAAGSPSEPPAAAPDAGKAPSADAESAPSAPPASPEAGKTPSAPPAPGYGPPVSPPPPPSAPLAYVPTIAAAPGPAPQAAPRPSGPVPPPTPPEHPAAAPPARTPEPAPAPADPARPHYVRQEPSPTPPPRPAPNPHPAPNPAWSAQRAVFWSPESLAIALSWLYGVYIAFKCVAVVMHLGFAGDIGDWKEADFALWTDVETLVGKADTLILVDSLLAVAAGVTTLVWFWRVRINAEAFAPREHRYSPGMAIGSWFIPVAGWIIPGKITFDIWYASLQDRHRGRPDEWGWQTTRRWPGRRLLGLWWGWVIVFSVSLSVVFFLPDVMRGAVDYPNAIYFDRMLSAVHWGTFLNLLCIPGVTLSIAVVRRLTELQDIRSAGPR